MTIGFNQEEKSKSLSEKGDVDVAARRTNQAKMTTKHHRKHQIRSIFISDFYSQECELINLQPAIAIRMLSFGTPIAGP